MVRTVSVRMEWRGVGVGKSLHRQCSMRGCDHVGAWEPMYLLSMDRTKNISCALMRDKLVNRMITVSREIKRGITVIRDVMLGWIGEVGWYGLMWIDEGSGFVTLTDMRLPIIANGGIRKKERKKCEEVSVVHLDVQKMKMEVEDKYGVGGMCAFLP